MYRRRALATCQPAARPLPSGPQPAHCPPKPSCCIRPLPPIVLPAIWPLSALHIGQHRCGHADAIVIVAFVPGPLDGPWRSCRFICTFHINSHSPYVGWGLEPLEFVRPSIARPSRAPRREALPWRTSSEICTRSADC